MSPARRSMGGRQTPVGRRLPYNGSRRAEAALPERFMPPHEPTAPQATPAPGAGDGLLQRLVAATPAERTALLLRLLDEQGERPLELAASDAGRWTLDGIDLSRESLRPPAREPPAW